MLRIRGSTSLSFWFLVGGQEKLNGAFAEFRRSGPRSFGAMLLVVTRKDCWGKAAERPEQALLVTVDRPCCQW